LAGAAAGAAIRVETSVGAVDVQIQERIKGGVRGIMAAEAKHRADAVLKTERE